MKANIRVHPLLIQSTAEEVDSSIEFAAKELQKMNAFTAPCEKLLCYDWCGVINNLLLDV